MPDINALPITWLFYNKLFDIEGQNVLRKARRRARGDFQIEDFYLAQYQTCRSVVFHEARHNLFANAAANGLFFECEDGASVNFYDRIDCEEYVAQPAKSIEHKYFLGNLARSCGPFIAQNKLIQLWPQFQSKIWS